MNIQKYILPASVAATVHVALFWLSPMDSRREGGGIVEVPIVLPPIPKPVDEPIVMPPETPPEKSIEPVKAMAGGPALPSLDEPFPTTKADFTIPMEERPKVPAATLNKVPEFGGGPGFGEAGTGLHVGPFSAIDLDNVPRAKVQIPPEYPYAMKQSGAGGRVKVEFDVDVSGRVVRAEAIDYTDREFVEPALRAVRKWRFEPGRRDGKAVPFRLTIPIEFNLEDAR